MITVGGDGGEEKEGKKYTKIILALWRWYNSTTFCAARATCTRATCTRATCTRATCTRAICATRATCAVRVLVLLHTCFLNCRRPTFESHCHISVLRRDVL